MKNRILHRVSVGIAAVGIVLVLVWTWWMRTPAGAVRNEILITGHPVLAATCHPSYDHAASVSAHAKIWTLANGEGYVTGDGSAPVSRFKISGGAVGYSARPQP
ncbi:hypothetical protein [Lacticaseibacillus nasuensis]|uniref:Uncharacterized protein n=1 Tax=Lacticaseibacillus nasuensis JCM 17158 TaxID=1291734 RepID=A0A0R1JPV4_9LACO|nr:hypothetical protein [Lacticaseibacillus nasuensis]KRK70404.1 hypothetical protein FD02_GL000469 [Lacticaseibacillus nasuensis JCM 17158]